jgi:hypothetical protein
MQNLRNLYNQALTAVGSAADVTNPEGTGRSVDLLNLWYPVARHSVFTAAHWPSLRSIKRLGLAATRDTSATWVDTNPAPGYIYAYAYEADMLQPQYMEDFTPFRITRVGAEKLIHSNTAEAVMCYTRDEAVPSTWEPDLYRAVVWALAACINMAKNGKMNVTEKLERQTLGIISQAAVNSANSDDEYFDAIPSFWMNSGFEVPSSSPRFYYPLSTFNLSGLF